MKKILATAMALLLIALMLCACASPEKMAQSIIKKQTGQDVEIKDGGSSLTITGKDGESATIDVGDNQKWPAGKMGDLPELKGKVKSIISSGGGYFLTLEDVSKADAFAYIQKLKDLGYSDGGEMQDESGLMVFSGNKGDAEVGFSYYPEGGSGAGISSVTITYSANK